MSEQMNIGFIGFGNMAGAMAKGLLDAGAAQPQQVFACAAHYEKLQKTAAAMGIHALATPAEVAAACDMVVVAVKPYLVESVLAPIADALVGKVVVSVAAGIGFERYEAILRPGTHHITVMPNTPIAVGEGILILEAQHSLSDAEYEAFCALFRQVALLEVVPSAQFSVAGTLAGCGPAFTAMFIEALADGAVKHGLARPAAYRLASQMLCGTGRLQLASGLHPGAMKDAVCSPGGTTIKGVAMLEEMGLRGAVIRAFDAIEGK